MLRNLMYKVDNTQELGQRKQRCGNPKKNS